MRFLVVCVVLAASALPAWAQTSGSAFPLEPYVGGRAIAHTTQGRTEAAYMGGRVVTHVTRGQTAYTYAWPGVYFEARFKGGAVEAKVNDDQNNLYLFVDGVHKLTLTRPGRATIALNDLGEGDHVVRLEKASETQDSTGTFGGYTVASADEALPPPQYGRRIEFIGDSITVGYGNTSRGQVCTPEDVSDTTDTSQAFAPLTAKHFGAAYRINAYSGDGVVRNYAGIRPGITLPVLYQYGLFDRSVPAPDEGWTPDVAVIDLGTNDFSTPLGAEEPWKSREALRVDFDQTYITFVRSLHAKWPAAHFILMTEPGTGTEVADAVGEVADALKKDPAIDLELVTIGGLDHMACHAHPSLKDDGMIAQLLIERISRLPKFAGAAAH